MAWINCRCGFRHEVDDAEWLAWTPCGLLAKIGASWMPGFSVDKPGEWTEDEIEALRQFVEAHSVGNGVQWSKWDESTGRTWRAARNKWQVLRGIK